MREARVVNEKDLDLPELFLHDDESSEFPSLDDEQIWEFAGERGCFSDSPESLKFCFRDLVHRNGILMYRMKPKKEYDFKLVREDNEGNLFDGVMIHDPMECFASLETLPEHETDFLMLMQTHASPDEPFEVMENWCAVPYDRFSKYLDQNTPMDDFREQVDAYFQEKKEQPTNKKRKTE